MIRTELIKHIRTHARADKSSIALSWEPAEADVSDGRGGHTTAVVGRAGTLSGRLEMSVTLPADTTALDVEELSAAIDDATAGIVERESDQEHEFELIHEDRSSADGHPRIAWAVDGIAVYFDIDVSAEVI